jgi:hypothetical protein
MFISSVVISFTRIYLYLPTIQILLVRLDLSVFVFHATIRGICFLATRTHLALCFLLPSAAFLLFTLS